MFSVRRLQEEDYTELVTWWKWHRFPAPAQEMLPDNGTCGLMVYKDGKNICSGFIYFTNSKIAWVEFIVSNPDYREKDRKEAIKYLIDQLGTIAQSKRAKVLYTNLKNASLINHFKSCDYMEGSVHTTEMIKVF